MSSTPPPPSWRKPVGMLGLLASLALYALIFSALADWLATLPKLIATLIYIVAGFAWLLPLRPLFIWMNTGHWRARGDDT